MTKGAKKAFVVALFVCTAGGFILHQNWGDISEARSAALHEKNYKVTLEKLRKARQAIEDAETPGDRILATANADALETEAKDHLSRVASWMVIGGLATILGKVGALVGGMIAIFVIVRRRAQRATLTPAMNPHIPALLNKIDVEDYTVEIPVTGNWVSYRYSPSPFAASKREGRYNPSGIDAFYLADSEQTARHEIRFQLDNKDLYTVKPCTIYAFDALKFAEDFSLQQSLTGAAEEGSYAFCQEIANYLTNVQQMSGIRYPSRQTALFGKPGDCVVLLPQDHQLVSGQLQIFAK